MSSLDVSRFRILVVDDNLHFRNLVRVILHAVGVSHIEESHDGAEAFEVLKTFPADLMILDWKMGGTDGVDCVKRIRSSHDSPSRCIPIIMVTGYTDPKLIKKARDAGIDDFLPKPISAKSLMSRIASVLSENRPFIDTESYFGPDRRFEDIEYIGTDRRKNISRIFMVDALATA